MDHRDSGLVRRLWLAAALAAVLAVGIVIALSSAEGSQGSARDQVTRVTGTLETVQRLERHVVDLESGLRGYVPTGDSLLLAPWNAARRHIPRDFAALEAQLGDDRAQAQRARALQSAIDAYISGYGLPIIAQAPVTGRRLDRLSRRGEQLFDALRARFAAFDAQEQVRLEAAEDSATDAGSEFSVIVVASAAALVILLLGLLAYAGRFLVMPVRRLAAACAQLGQGIRPGPVPESGAPEMRELTAAFNRMVRQLEEREDALRDALARAGEAGALVEATPDAVLTTDPEGMVTSWNPGAERLYGYAEHEIVGRSVAELSFEPDREVAQDTLARAAAGETVAVAAVRRRRKDGSPVHVSLSAAPLLDPDGRLVGFTGISRDVSEEYRLTAELARAEERQRLLLANLPDTLVALYDLELRCLMLDGPMVRKTGIDPATYLGRPLRETLAPDHYESLAPMIARALEGEATSTDWTSSLSGVSYALDVAPYRLPDGTIAGAFAVARDVSERLAAQRELSRRERMLAESQAVAHVGSWELDLAIGRIDWSDELCRIAGRPLGFSPTVEEYLALVHPDDRGRLRTRVDAVVEGIASDSEYRIVRPDGEIRHVLTSRFPRRDEAGRVTHLYGTTQDVTDRVEHEAELRRLASIVEQSGEAITSKDAEGRITGWNRAAERLYGYTAREAVGQPVSMLVPPDLRGEEKRLLVRALAGETVRQYRTRRLRRDGSILHVSLTVSPLHDELSRPVGASVITRDITARVQAEREREQALAALAEAQAIAQVGSWTWDVEADEASWSQEMFRIFGRDAADGPATGEEFFTYLHPEDRDRLAAGYAQAFGGGEGFELDYRIRAGDGAERVLHALARQERPGHYSGTVQDVTQLRAVERALAYSEEFFRASLEHAPIGVALVSPEGRWLKVNRAVCEMTGYGEEELLGITFQEITHPDDLDADLDHRRRLLCGDIASYRMEKRYLQRSGRQLWVELSVSLVRDERGEAVHFIAQIRDITAERDARAALQASERRYQSIAANIPGMVYRFALSPNREFSFPFVSAGARLVYGLEPEALMEDASLIVAAMHPDDRQGLVESIVASATTLEPWEWQGRHVMPGGEVRYVRALSHPQLEPDGTIVWDGVVLDETEVRVAQEHEAQLTRELEVSLERFQVAFERAPIGMVIVGLDGRFQRVNDALCEITGHAAADLLAMAPFALIHPEDVAAVRREYRSLGQHVESLTIEHRIAHCAGHLVWVQARVTLIRDDAGRPLHALAQVQDVTERRSYEERLKHMADHDPLTGLLNRRGFEASLEAHLARCRRYGATGALLVLDLDGFKMVNDTLGHAAGDELIVGCAQALSGRLRETDVVARLGGDEFAILLPDESQSEAETVAQALVDTVREQTATIADSHPGRVTASIGVASFGDGSLTADEMLVSADLAMYEAKEAGRDRYALYSHDGRLVPRIKAQMTWLERIERALSEERFVLHAQPVVDLRTGATVQHEVLVRMLDEQGDVIPPASFLYIAERFGVIRDLDRWVVAQSIRAMARRQAAAGAPLPLAVNISALSTANTDLLDTISRELREGSVPAGELTLEVTETAAVADIPRARRFADALKDIGCRFALDDFGAGFGSFYYLKHLPFDVVKIDGEFVRHAIENAADRLVIKAVAEIARGLGKQTVAEFVPDERTIRLLLRHGVDFAQGFYLGRPQPLEELLVGLPSPR